MKTQSMSAACGLLAFAAALVTECVMPATSCAADPVVARVTEFTVALEKGNIDELKTFYDDKVMIVGPATLEPLTSRQAVLEFHKAQAPKEKLVYFRLRQPNSAKVDEQTALVIANYEKGAEQGGTLVETNGKVLFVLWGKAPSYSIGAEVVVPNLNAGTYGAMGTAITARPWGRFPSKAVPPPNVNEEPTFNAGWERELFETTKKINATFPKDSVDAMLAFADPRISIWAGDYGPFYIWGVDQARIHFADFFRTSKMREIRAFRPIIRQYGGIRMVYFQFEETLHVENELRRNPGQATYSFLRSSSRLAACTETSVVVADIGDPYPVN
jgi:hypothetical protein